MGNNDFTAGDPWGLPIEDSEDIEIDAPRPEGDGEPDVPVDDVEEIEAPVDHDFDGAEGDPEPDVWYSAEPAVEALADVEPALEEDNGDAEPEVESGASSPTAEEPEPIAFSQEAVDETNLAEAGEDDVEEDEDDYEFKAPSRTPLSQMIAAAQSVVSSVQGDHSDEVDEVDEFQPHDAEQAVVDEIAADDETQSNEDPAPGEPAADQYIAEPAAATDEDDLPEELPSWMVVDPETDEGQAGPSPVEEIVEPGDEYAATDDQSFTPEDIEASIEELATPEPAEAPFAEDRFEMPGGEEPETEEDFGVVDMDSSPGVYSELVDLADQDSQAEALLREAAAAFGGTDETTIEPLDEDVQELADEPTPDTVDIDSYADALATELGTDDTTIEPLDEDVQELADEPTPDTVDIDSYADALATELGTDDTTIEPLDEDVQELGSGEHKGFADPNASEPLTDLELGAALAGLAGASSGEDPAATTSSDAVDEEEPVGAGWWSEETEPLVAEIPTEELSDEEEPAAAAFAGEALSSFGMSDESMAEDIQPAAVASGLEAVPTDEADEIGEEGAGDAVALDAAAVIDSPVEWGTRYREAHQGWVEDDEGRSTWRPIVTSGESVAGWDIDIYLGLVSGDVSINPESAETVAPEVAVAREGAVRSMLDEALARGAHAVVGVTFSIQDVAGTALVAASGVAVTLRTPA